MTCYYPQKTYRVRTGRDPVTGRWPVTFDKNQGYQDKEVIIACGKCIGCRLEYSRQWAIRCFLESKDHDNNCFITLTYDDKNLVEKCGVRDDDDNVIAYSLNRKEITLFIKKLRKSIPYKKIKYFQCGEYGDTNGRPHHHMIVFNHDFKKKLFWKEKNGVPLYKDSALDKMWGNGYCVIGDMSLQSAGYVARYIMKKINGEQADEYYDGIEPEYTTMSRGIGKARYDKYGEDYINADAVVVNGQKVPMPKYFDRLLEKENPNMMNRIKYRREVHRRKKDKNENSFERLEVKEKIKRKRIQTLQRRV